MTRTRHRLQLGLTALIAALGVLVATSHAGPAHQGVATDAPSGLGMIGPYTDADLGPMRAAGVRQTLVELSWAQAEPSPGSYDLAYLRAVDARAQRLRAAGFATALNTGIQDAPAWALDRPGARYVDQSDRPYTAEPLPNLVFDLPLRAAAAAYLSEVFAVMGTDFSLVRAGGGHFGELGYPFVLGADGLVENRYWAFDVNARRNNPVPGWRPGDPSPHGEAQRFLTWYLDALAGYQDWQVSALRTAGYDGWVAMLYPSFGMRPGDEAAAVADDLSGRSSAEINGEVQRGYDWSRQIAALTDRRVVVYGTWGEQPQTLAELASLARAKRLPVMAENSGDNTTEQLDSALADARRLGLNGFFLVRAPTLIGSGTGGLASLRIPRFAETGAA